MKRIDSRHLRPLFDAVYETNLAKNQADFISDVTAGMRRLIRCDV